MLELLKQYGELKSENLRRLYFQEEGFSHIERGIRVAEFTRINRDLPRRIVTQGVEINFKYTGQPITCYRWNSTEHVVRNCDKQRRVKPTVNQRLAASGGGRHTWCPYTLDSKWWHSYRRYGSWNWGDDLGTLAVAAAELRTGLRPEWRTFTFLGLAWPVWYLPFLYII